MLGESPPGSDKSSLTSGTPGIILLAPRLASFWGEAASCAAPPAPAPAPAEEPPAPEDAPDLPALSPAVVPDPESGVSKLEAVECRPPTSYWCEEPLRMENHLDSRPGDSPGVVTSSRWVEELPPPEPFDGMVQALARRKIMLLELGLSVCDPEPEPDPDPDPEPVVEPEPVVLPMAAVRHLSKDKCCLALLKVERNWELRWLPALRELTLLLVCSSSVRWSSSSGNACCDPSSSCSCSCWSMSWWWWSFSGSLLGDLVSLSLLLLQLLRLRLQPTVAAWPPLAL